MVICRDGITWLLSPTRRFSVDVKITTWNFTREKFTEDDACAAIESIKAGDISWLHVRCDSQYVAEFIRDMIFKQAMKDGGQYEITILGSGAAVGVKKPVPSLYTYVDDGHGRLKQISIEDYKKEHSNDGRFR